MKDEFGKYYEAKEPGRRERAYAWATAIGLQDVDGLKPSKYLIKAAKRGYDPLPSGFLVANFGKNNLSQDDQDMI